MHGLATLQTVLADTPCIGFMDIGPASPDGITQPLQALADIGYREGVDLFGAPYDFRLAADGLEQVGRAHAPSISRLHLHIRQL